MLRAPHEQREGVAVTVDCDDGWRRYVEPARLRPALTMIDGGAPLYQREAAAAAVSGRSEGPRLQCASKLGLDLLSRV